MKEMNLKEVTKICERTETDEVKRKTFIADDGTGSYRKRRTGSRAIIICDNKLLLGHERATGYYTIPGGGHEEGETLEETCIREIEEEMGMIVTVHKEVAVAESWFLERIFENHFFLCSYKGDTRRHQTEEEANADLSREWVTFEEAEAIFNDPEVITHGPAWTGCYKRDAWVLEVLKAFI